MIQLQVINYMLQTKDSSMILTNDITSEFFSDYQKEFRFIMDHFDQYGNIPDEATFYNQFPDFDAIEVRENVDYLIDALYEDRNTRKMAEAFNAVRNSLNAGDNEGAMASIRKVAEDMAHAKHLDSVDVLRDHSRYDAYVERCTNFDKYFIKTGFSELDEILGGWDAQEEYGVIVARPNVGKSWILAKCAVAAAQQGKRVGMYSGEMSDRKVGYRVDTLISNISNWDLTKGMDKSMVDYKRHLEYLHSTYDDNNPGCLKVLTPEMNGGLATVTDLRAFIEKENLDVLFVDQFSLLEDQRNAREPFTKLANISKDIKALQVMKQMPIICVSQQNRASTELGTSVANIAGSDRIGQDATTVIFIEKEGDDGRDLILHIVKSRDSVNGGKLKYHVNLNNGIFEFIPEDDSDLMQSEMPDFSNVRGYDQLNEEIELPWN